MKLPNLLRGGSYTDQRGTISFFNDFDLSPIKRYYIIRHPDKKVVRAWQGHQKEQKYFQCLKGRFLVAWKKIDDFSLPTDSNPAKYTILEHTDNKVLFIPAGYANGLKALENDSEIMVFSNHSLDESSNDQFKFDKNLWLDWTQF